MKKLIVVVSFLIAVSAHADDALIRKNGCIACHQNATKVVGPALKDIAAKYKNRKDAVDYLSKKIRAGGGGVWGPMPMPAQPHVTEADAKKLATHILTVK